jgi:hypothetical protein
MWLRALSLCLLAGGDRRVRGAICLHRPADQQQSKHNAEHELFLPGQAIHCGNITERRWITTFLFSPSEFDFCRAKLPPGLTFIKQRFMRSLRFILPL